MIHLERRHLRRTAVIAVVTAVALVSIAASPTNAQPQERETFRALAQSLAAGISGQTNIIIMITGRTSGEDADRLEGILRSDGTEALANALRNQPEVGRFRIPTEAGTGWPLRFAEERIEDGKRYLTLMADRPIAFQEAVNRPQRTWKYQISLIELVLDENDQGEGTMQVGVDMRVDPDTGAITIADITTQPIRLLRVRK